MPVFLVFMTWHDFAVALALMFVIEGIIPFLSPRGMREMLREVIKLDDRSIRVAGLVSMVIGAILIALLS